MADAGRASRGFPLLLLGFVLIAGGAFAVYVDCREVGLAVEGHSCSTGNLKIHWLTARSRILRRPISRLILIEGPGAKSFPHFEWRRYPAEWNEEKKVLVSDGEGIRYASPAVFHHLWSDSQILHIGMSLLRQAAEEARDKTLKAFLARHSR